MIVRSRPNDPWVFRARSPEDLFAPHADAIGSALAPGERVEYMLYAPLYPAEGGRFGIHGAAASHGIAITQTRLLVSADPMREGTAPCLEVIPFESVLTVEIGSALALGWFVVRFGSPEGMASKVVFFRASGMHHFREVVRAYRALTPAAAPGAAGVSWVDTWKKSPEYLTHAVRPVVLEAESLLHVTRSSERWMKPRRGRRARAECVCPTGLLLFTDVGLLWVLSEPALRPGVPRFGVNVVCIRREAAATAAVESHGGDDDHGLFLRLELGVRARLPVRIPVDADCRRELEEIRRDLGRGGHEAE